MRDVRGEGSDETFPEVLICRHDMAVLCDEVETPLRLPVCTT